MLPISYKLTLYTRVRYTLGAFARFLGLMSNPSCQEDAEFQPIDSGACFLLHYRQSLIHFYVDPKHRDIGFERWKVFEIRTYKDEQSTAKHEYLVATLRNEYGTEVLLRIDRLIRHSPTNSTSTRPGPAAGSSVDADTATPNEPATGKFSKFARDEISIISQDDFNRKRHQLLVDHTQFTEAVPLPQFIVLGCSITEDRYYHILNRNCYWFCHATSQVLRKLFASTPQDVGNNEQGRFHWVSVCPKVEVDDAVTKYRDAWGKFCDEITRFKNNPDNDDLRKERQRADRLQQELDETKAKLALHGLS